MLTAMIRAKKIPIGEGKITVAIEQIRFEKVVNAAATNIFRIAIRISYPAG